MNAATLAARGTAFAARQQPALIKIAGHTYACSRSSFRAEQVLTPGGFVAIRKVTFQILRSAFSAVQQPEPEPGDEVELCDEKKRLSLATSLPDPTGTMLLLRCQEPPQ